ncbi:MAG: DoxX family protein [Bacteroidetes bacterium]|nr:MAG: DoxX family protein [Bacteroidota bacterium]
MRFLTQLCRILVGVLFIFSGLIKANDPLGFSYKLDEYFSVFGTEFMIPLSLMLAIFICAYEIIFGIMLLFGSRITLTVWALFLMIVFFTFLTFYSAYYDKVKECGCFGDFLHLTPWQSFYKDVALLVMILALLAGKKFIYPLLSSGIEKFLVAGSVIASLAFPLYTYNFLPVKDFRPYAIGKNIPEGMILPPHAVTDSIQMVFIYEKDGKQVELTPEQIKTIDSTYKYVDRKDKVIREGDKPAIHDFSIQTVDGSDYTEQILNYSGYYFFLVCYDLDKANTGVFGKVIDFAKLCRADSIPITVLTASSDRIESFKKETGADMDFYLTDQTTLKTMIRSNPGLMLLKQGTVIDMWHHHSFPSYTDVKGKYFGK